MFKVFSFVLAAHLFFDFSTASACSCALPGSPVAEAHNADAVFSGKVIGISSIGSDEQQVTFDVDRTWKGINSATKTVSTSAYGSMCGNGYAVGESWLVYATGGSKLSTNSCSRTTLVQSARADLSALGAGQVAPPGPTASEGQAKTAGVAFILFVGAAAAWVTLKFKR